MAHADDWQLFMQPAAYNDLVYSGCKIVFIITTAGDAGMDEKYWKSREEGHKSSVRFCTSPIDNFPESCSEKNYNNKNISYWSLHHSITYFLRLPDGNLDGSGFASNNYQSLSKFQSSENDTIKSLDASATFSNWLDFIQTLQSIISCESEGIGNKNLHYMHPDPGFNPGDHADHITTGIAIRHLKFLTHFNQFLYVGYSNQTSHEKLLQSDLFWKTGMFAAYEKAVFDLCGYSTLRENTLLYISWCCSKPIFQSIPETVEGS